MLRLRAVAVTVVSVCAVALMVGCGGIKEADLDAAQARLDMLRTKGLPDDSTATAKVNLYQARELFAKGNKGQAKSALDTARVYLDRAEKFYNGHVATLGPAVEQARAKALEAKGEMSGHQVKKIDSILTIVDSLKRSDWLLLANNKAVELVGMLPALKEDEANSARIRRLVPGVWEYTERDKSEEFREVNALTTKTFNFGRDGKIHLIEKKSGQSGQFLKEDWEFQSWGTYDYRGDTIMLAVSRFASIRQNMTTGIPKDGKIEWKLNKHPTYDSAITDGSQDRYVTYEDLKVDFKQKRKF